MRDKWQDLFATIEIIQNFDDGIEIPDEREIEIFEEQTRIVLPIDYKYFCGIFGTGRFTSDLMIYCLPSSKSSDIVLTAIKNEIDMFPHGQNRFMEVDDIKNLLDSALMFGDTSCADIFFWDLKTYNALDCSYDIYWADGDVFDGYIRKIGRDFFEFVRDFCIGDKFLEIILLKGQTPSKQGKPAFARFARK
jgi:hypothetical protein